MPSAQEIRERLRSVPYPGYSRDVVSFGLIRDIEVGGLGVTITLTPSTNDPETIAKLQRVIGESLQSLEVGEIRFAIEEAPKSSLAAARPKARVGDVKRVLAVASGKGGVGKSTVAVNLALALRNRGHAVGLLDADIYGPSVPVMLGLEDRPTANEQKRIEPLMRHGIRAISMGLFVDAGKPIIWRGPMITKLLTEFFRNVIWGELDYLVVDLPPGTGDAQLTICQQIPLDGGIIVSTPQEVALLDVQRGVTMFQEVNVPVLGVVENMSLHRCRACGHETAIFGTGGAESMADRFGIPFLGRLPLLREIREAGDRGTPIVAADANHPQSRLFLEIANRIAGTFTGGNSAPGIPAQE